VNELGGRSSLYSTFRPHAGPSLAKATHSLRCLRCLFQSRVSEGRVVWLAGVSLLVIALDTMHAPSIRLGDLTLRCAEFGAPSASSHFATVLLTCSFVIRSLLHHPAVLRRKPLQNADCTGIRPSCVQFWRHDQNSSISHMKYENQHHTIKIRSRMRRIIASQPQYISLLSMSIIPTIRMRSRMKRNRFYITLMQGKISYSEIQ
jgi:hypothetical protein